MEDEEQPRIPGRIGPSGVRRDQTAPGFVSRADEDRMNAEARQQSFMGALGDAFTSGDNILVQTVRAVDRKLESGPPDENWNGSVVDEWVKTNKINPYDEWRYKATRNMNEAILLKADQDANSFKQDRLSRRGGFSTFMAQGLAGVIDIDAPVAILTGGLSAAAKTGYNATKLGRLMTGAATGALTMGAAGSVGYAVNPAEDWTLIPSMMLMGGGFGMLGGAFAKGPDNALSAKGNAELNTMKNDIGENIAEGTPLARQAENPPPVDELDPYGARAREEAEEAVAPAPEAPRAPRAIDVGEAPDGMSAAPEVDEGPLVGAAKRAADILSGKDKTPTMDDVKKAADEILNETPVEEAAANANRKQALIATAARVATSIADGTFTDAAEAAGDLLGDVVKYGRSTVGATQLKPGATIADIASEQQRIIVTNAQAKDARLGLETRIDDTYMKKHGISGVVQNALTNFQQLIERTPFTSDFNRFTRSQSAVLRVVAYDTMESGSGLLRNNDNASRYFKQYHIQGTHMISDFPDIMTAWVKDKKGAGQIAAALREDYRIEFNNLLRSEMNSRFYGRTNANVDPLIKAAADKLDDFYKWSLEIEKGRPGQGSVAGMKDAVPQSGYTPQAWASSAYRRMIDSGRKHKDIVQAIFENYKTVYPAIKDTDLKIYAKALADRMKLGSTEGSTNILSWINADGREAVELFIARQNNVSPVRAKAIVDGLTGARQTAGRAGYTKQRMDVDYDFIASNGIKLGDLLENDLYGLAVRRAHSSAGRAALARKGFYSRTDWENMVNAAMSEQEELLGRVKTTSPRTGNPMQDTALKVKDAYQDFIDNPMKMSREDLNEIYNYFSGAPVRGGSGKWISTMKKVANLSLLGQLGFSQAAEFGVTMAAMGTKKFFKDLPKAAKAAISDPGSGLHQDLKMLGTYTPDDRLHRFDQTYATESMKNDQAWFAKFNHVLNSAGRVQGFTSLFFQMQRTQHTMAVDATVNKLFMHYNGTKPISANRIRDMLGDENTLGPKLQQYIQNGTVKFDADGYVETLNLDQWNIDDVDAFARAINASTHQLIQRPMIGESSLAFYGDGVASLFFHLKSFPLLAMEKQFVRNARIADRESMGAFLFSLGTAALAYTAKQAINLREDNLDFESIARGTFQMNNIAGWLPLWTDPIGGMLGMDQDYGRSTSILSTPAAIPTIDRLLRMPSVFFQDDVSRSDIYALQSIPIVGNMIGFTALANLWKDSVSERKATERRAAKAAEEKPEEVQEAPAPEPEAVKPPDELTDIIDALNKQGISDPQKFIQRNLGDGITVDEIRKAWVTK